MPNKELTEIVLVVDRSGSMMTCKNDAEGGINALIQDQQLMEGKANFTLVQFDYEYQFIHEGVDIGDVPNFHLNPRGSTALLDAVGRAIVETGERLEKMDESERPGLVTFVIVTDGEENSSREFNLEQVKAMIKEQTDKYSWQFSFLGAGLDAFHGGASMGMPAGATAMYKSANTGIAMAAASANVSRMRSATMKGDTVTNSYLDSELKDMQS